MDVTFYLLLVCVATTQYRAQCAAAIGNSLRTNENCRRISNELDQNNIVDQQRACDSRTNLNDYYRDREDFLNFEIESSFGSDIKLNENESLANEIIMKAKADELNAGFLQPHLFNPARHIFEVLDVIKQSKLFQFIQKMPKGGILHAHDTALCSADFVVSLTYWPHLWQRTTNNSNDNDIVEFVFSRGQPSNQNANESDGTVWRLVKDVRIERGAPIYDQQIRSMFTLFDKNVNPRIQFTDINDVWNHFMRLFIKSQPIISFVPAWKAYYKNALKEMQEDGVQYLEFRGTLPQVLYFCFIYSNCFAY